MNDETLLNALEQIVKSDRYWEDTILCWDHEDGFWLASVERGSTHPWPVKDATLKKRRTLREAIAAAVEWHNKESKKPFHEGMAITTPPRKKAEGL